ncbi:L-serine ammonia-lyase, iron-sulfur-dependent, subunit beta [Oceanithermus sp.]
MPLTLADIASAEAPASRLVLAEEVEETGLDPDFITAVIRERLRVMRQSVERGLRSREPSTAGMVGWNAATLWEADDPLHSPLLKRVQAYAMAVNEENARMGKVVAAPTAGSAGTLPGALLGVFDHLGMKDEEKLVGPTVLAGGIAKVISRTIFIAGASGGCQAEIGSSAAMAAAAVVELLEGSPAAAVNAAALALQNTLGLVCDPVGGYVEIPCVMRNGFYAVHAVSAAQQALAGITSPIPADEVILAMANVGRLLPPELKETGEGGLACTPTAQKLLRRLSDEE